MEFLAECRDYIQRAEASLLALETDPENDEEINAVFRAFHTIKGNSAFMNIAPVNELAHHAESLLSRIRDKEIRFSGKYANLALQTTDTLSVLLRSAEESLAGAHVTKPEQLDTLLALLANPEADTGADQDDADSEATLRLGDILVGVGFAEREEIEQAAADQGDDLLGETLVRSGIASPRQVAKALRTQQRMASADTAGESVVRVRTDRLDSLIDMVGELVIAHSMVAQDETVLSDVFHTLQKKVGHTGKLVKELQDLSMSMRMVPLKATFQKMTRLVRDVSRKSDKQVSLLTEGEETEIDRNMVDVLADPLVHMVRNAVDHGIEPPEVRERLGKPRVGTIRLSAFHAEGNVVVRIEDDGRGLDQAKLLEKAVARGLITPDAVLSESEVFGLIFRPGFSTADVVTDVSGRGVGMDVVRRNVESLGGHIDVRSQTGKNSVFSLHVPLTLAVTDGMLVKVGEQRYIIPTVNISMSFRPQPADLSTIANRGEMVFFHAQLLPILRLHRLFDVTGAIQDSVEGVLVIVEDAGTFSALLVDGDLGATTGRRKASWRGHRQSRGNRRRRHPRRRSRRAYPRYGRSYLPGPSCTARPARRGGGARRSEVIHSMLHSRPPHFTDIGGSTS